MPYLQTLLELITSTLLMDKFWSDVVPLPTHFKILLIEVLLERHAALATKLPYIHNR